MRYLAILLALLAACSSDLRVASLEKTVNLMASIVQSKVLVDAVRNADPQMRATTAARGSLTGGITANFPRPPDDVSIVESAAEVEPWCVLIISDDAAKEVRLQGYAADKSKPALVKKFKFPPA